MDDERTGDWRDREIRNGAIKDQIRFRGGWGAKTVYRSSPLFVIL